MTIDTQTIRSYFPALGRHIGETPVAYFDGPGGTQVPTPVVEAISDYLLHHNANTHWAFPTSVETDAAIMAAREAVADLLGCATDEVTFGANMTTLTFHLARALARGWNAGDEIIITELDHHANVAPWMAAAKERGLVVRSLPVRADLPALDYDALPALLGPRTRLVAIGAASNAVGTINQVARVAAAAHEAGALVFVDAVHLAPHRLLSVAELGADFLACSAYKFLGPHLGILYVRRALAAEIDTPKLEPAPNHGGERFETGTQNHEGIVGARAAIDFAASFGQGRSRRERLASWYSALEAHERALVAQLWEGLGNLPGVERFGLPADADRTPTVAFRVHGQRCGTVAERLAQRGVFVSHGDFYASTLVPRLAGTDGLLRAGCAPYTTAQDVAQLLDAVAEVTRD